MTPIESAHLQLRSLCQGETYQTRTLLRTNWVYEFGAERATLRFTGSTAAHFDPFVVRRLVHDVGDEDDAVEKLIQRLCGDPINIPKTYVDNLNLVIIQSAIKRPDG